MSKLDVDFSSVLLFRSLFCFLPYQNLKKLSLPKYRKAGLIAHYAHRSSTNYFFMPWRELSWQSRYPLFSLYSEKGKCLWEASSAVILSSNTVTRPFWGLICPYFHKNLMLLATMIFSFLLKLKFIDLYKLLIKLNYYSFKIFPRFWLAKSTRIIHHNQLLKTKIIWKNFAFNEPMTSKVQLSCTLMHR